MSIALKIAYLDMQYLYFNKVKQNVNHPITDVFSLHGPFQTSFNECVYDRRTLREEGQTRLATWWPLATTSSTPTGINFKPQKISPN